MSSYIDEYRHISYDAGMGSLNVSMPDELRAFVDRRAKEGGFSTPTEYVRSLIRADRAAAERDQFGPLLVKWLTEGLSADEEAALPLGLLDRAREKLRRMVEHARRSGDGGAVTREHLEQIKRDALTGLEGVAETRAS